MMRVSQANDRLMAICAADQNSILLDVNLNYYEYNGIQWLIWSGSPNSRKCRV